jgi:predicted transcriptional regulator
MSPVGKGSTMAIKAKNITIRIRSLDQGLDNFVETAEALLKDEAVKKQRGVYFENLDSFRKVLTEKRMTLLHAVKQHKPDTIHELARLLGRDIKNVSDDLKYLAELGLVSLDKSAEGSGRKVAPRVKYEKIRLEIEI